MSDQLPLGTINTGLISSAVISDCGTYRYRLTRIWDESKPVLAWVMLNPSTADASTNDPTIRRCIGFAKAWGYGGIVVVNLYALRATDPKQLWQDPDPVGPDNDAELAAVAEKYSLIVMAWGANAKLDRAGDVQRILRRVYDRPGGKCAVLGWTKQMHPLHPLYLSADTRPMRADIPPAVAMPQRIQRKRTAGWRMPEGTVYVGRPGKWGNPFSEVQIGEDYPSLSADQVHSMAVQQFRDLVRCDRPITLYQRPFGGAERDFVTYTYPPRAEIIAELSGRDLACWCSLDEACHADVLLEIANGEL